MLYDSMMLESKESLERVAKMVRNEPLDNQLRIIFGDEYDFNWLATYDQQIVINLN